MRQVVVIGVGLSKFGRFPEKSFEDLTYPAIEHALEDAGISFKDIEVAFCGVVESGVYDSRRVVQNFGWTGIMIHSLSQASGSSAAAFRVAYWLIAAGYYDTALVVGYEKMPKGLIAGTLFPGTSHLDVMGLDPIPARVALEMRKRMQLYNEPLQAFATVAAQASEYAALNPHAHYQVKHSVEEVMNSPVIADPLTLYMCCPVSDGASAAIICSAQKARRLGVLKRAVYVAGAACASPQVDDLVGGPGADIGGDFKGGNVTRRLAAELYNKTGIGPNDIDVAQMHDPFTHAVFVDLEALGFCKEGEAGRFVLEGNLGPQGKIPTNTDGGLLCKGHPMGATGTAQVAEIVKQLRGEAGPRQVPGNPKVGLTHSSGAGMMNLHMLKK
ncbi:MAG: thiolase family protein [Chloroflexi bacterium]|nr:thiolase family protein [Chloroflexota bacterium]